MDGGLALGCPAALMVESVSAPVTPVPATTTPASPTVADGAAAPGAQPHGPASVFHTIKFLVSLLNPQDRHNTDTMRATGLTVLEMALQVGGRTLAHYPAILGLIKMELCRHLFSLVFSWEPRSTTVRRAGECECPRHRRR